MYQTGYTVKLMKLSITIKRRLIIMEILVTYIAKDNAVYKGCKRTVDDRKCQKKLIDEQNGNYRCERCDASDNEFEYRIILKATVSLALLFIRHTV